MPPKLTPEAIAGTLNELVVFAETNAATLAARNGTCMLSFAHVVQARAAGAAPAVPAAPEGAARKRPRRDADRAATHDDDLLCDWIDALAWLETDAANAATPAQVRRLRELAAALGKQPVTRMGLTDAVQHFQV